jgi:hypothetical protein
LLWWREAVLDVEAVHVTNMITEPAVERIVRRGHTLECRVEVVALPEHDHEVAVRRWLEEDGFAADTKTSA